MLVEYRQVVMESGTQAISGKSPERRGTPPPAWLVKPRRLRYSLPLILRLRDHLFVRLNASTETRIIPRHDV